MRCAPAVMVARRLRGVRRSLATASWNHLLPRTVARTLPRSIRRALAGVRRPLRRDEREILWHFGGVAPARRHAKGQHSERQSEEPKHSHAVTLHGGNIGQRAVGGQSA